MQNRHRRAPGQLQDGGPLRWEDPPQRWAVRAASIRLRQHCKPRAGQQPPGTPSFSAQRGWSAVCSQGNEALHKTLRIVVPSSTHLGSEYTQAVRATAGELRVAGTLAATSRGKCDPVALRRSSYRAAIASDWRYQGGIAAHGLVSRGCSVDDEVQPTSVIGGNAGAVVFASHCCGATLRPNCLTDDLDPCPLKNEAAAGEQAGGRACWGMVPEIIHDRTAAWCAISSTAGSRERQRQAHTAPKCEVHQIRRGCCGRIGRDGRELRPGMWASLGAQQRSDVRTHGRHQDLLSKRSVKCESSIPLPAMSPYAWLARCRQRRCRSQARFPGRPAVPSNHGHQGGCLSSGSLEAGRRSLSGLEFLQAARWAASGQRCCNTGSESAHAAQYAAGDRRSACIRPRPLREGGRKAMPRAWLCAQLQFEKTAHKHGPTAVPPQARRSAPSFLLPAHCGPTAGPPRAPRPRRVPTILSPRFFFLPRPATGFCHAQPMQPLGFFN